MESTEFDHHDHRSEATFGLHAMPSSDETMTSSSMIKYMLPTSGSLRTATEEESLDMLTTSGFIPDLSNASTGSDYHVTSSSLSALKFFPLFFIVVFAVFGNVLVIVSVFRFERLRVVANSFIVSLAAADLLVALLVMPFNASQEVLGRWIFGRITCDIFNANDVLFSTASLLHLCCISLDRYIAIIDPFSYATKMTRRRVAAMLFGVWGASALLSHVPIHMGWYTTPEHLNTPMIVECLFEVNKVYVVISSTISFWTPAAVMVFAYVKIFREAKRQERRIGLITLRNGSVVSSSLDATVASEITSTSGSERKLCSGVYHHPSQHRQNRRRAAQHRDNKAAKTLGIIMGAFLFCWLPFFVWYVTSTLCADTVCHFNTPAPVVSILFWIGYANSALNPAIYALYNRDFRRAFRSLLSCCSGSKNVIRSNSDRVTSLARMVTSRRSDQSMDVPSRRCSRLGSSSMSFENNNLI